MAVGTKDDAYLSPADEELADLLMEELPFGRNRGLSTRDLAELVGTNERKVRKLVEHLRRECDLPIAASPEDGYYIPASFEQGEETRRILAQRAETAQAVLEGYTRGLSRLHAVEREQEG